MLFTDVQRSVRLNKKKKSTNISPYPDDVIDRLARAFYPAILALLEQRGRPAGVCRVAGGAGSYCNQRNTGSSRWGTPCLTYRVWIFQGASGRAHLIFLCFVL